MENPAVLLRRLNPYCARAMEGAASLCQTRAHAEILRDHFQPALLARFQTVIYRPLAKSAMRTISGNETRPGEQASQPSLRPDHPYRRQPVRYAHRCLLPDTGARNVDSLLNQQILPVLSQQLLTHSRLGRRRRDPAGF